MLQVMKAGAGNEAMLAATLEHYLETIPILSEFVSNKWHSEVYDTSHGYWKD